ncbi:MAG: DUF4097 family beta strand repeat-containing protein [bacterium]
MAVYAGAGEVDAAGVDGDLRLDSHSGSVTAVDIRGRLTADTGSGRVLVYLPQAINAELEVDTGSGGIDIEVPVDHRKKSRSHVLGQIGDGSGRIYIDTGSGEVRILCR